MTPATDPVHQQEGTRSRTLDWQKRCTNFPGSHTGCVVMDLNMLFQNVRYTCYQYSLRPFFAPDASLLSCTAIFHQVFTSLSDCVYLGSFHLPHSAQRSHRELASVFVRLSVMSTQAMISDNWTGALEIHSNPCAVQAIYVIILALRIDTTPPFRGHQSIPSCIAEQRSVSCCATESLGEK